MTTLTEQSPVEIDTFLAKNYEAQATVQDDIRSILNQIEWVKRRKGTLSQIDALREKEQAARARQMALIVASAPYQAEYHNRGGWNRYFLVQNGNGHVHRGMDCSTCYPTTRYSWLIELADCDEDAMVEEWGEKACTVCFPAAPTNPLYHRPSRLDREARAARDAEKAAKEAEKAAKAERIAQREAKAAAKAAQVEADKAAGTYKLSAAEKRDAAIGRIAEAAQAKDWATVVEIVNEARALGKTERWQTALRQMEVIAAARAHLGGEPDGRYFQALINLGWANA